MLALRLSSWYFIIALGKAFVKWLDKSYWFPSLLLSWVDLIIPIVDLRAFESLTPLRGAILDILRYLLFVICFAFGLTYSVDSISLSEISSVVDQESSPAEFADRFSFDDDDD